MFYPLHPTVPSYLTQYKILLYHCELLVTIKTLMLQLYPMDNSELIVLILN